jgi:hypothetical protein
MAAKFTLPEEAKIVACMAPATDAAGRTGTWVTLKNAMKAYIVWHIAQGNAATILLTINQATKVAGTGSKVITGNARWWFCANSASTDLLVRQADGVNFTTDAGVFNKIVVAEVDPDSLDIANAFCCVTGITGASNVANLTQAAFFLAPDRYPSATGGPSAILD